MNNEELFRQQQFGGQNINQQTMKMSKQQIKTKISSRKDFVALFGFECKLNSGILPASKKVDYLAFYHRSS